MKDGSLFTASARGACRLPLAGSRFGEAEQAFHYTRSRGRGRSTSKSLSHQQKDLVDLRTALLLLEHRAHPVDRHGEVAYTTARVNTCTARCRRLVKKGTAEPRSPGGAVHGSAAAKSIQSPLLPHPSPMRCDC